MSKKPSDPKATIRAAKSWQTGRRPLAPVSLAPVKLPDLRYYMAGLDPDDVTDGNGDG